MSSKSEMIIYQTEDGLTKVTVTFEEDTVWLSLEQMAQLFQRDKSVISRHIKKYILKANCAEKELLQKMQQFSWKASEMSNVQLSIIIWM